MALRFFRPLRRRLLFLLATALLIPAIFGIVAAHYNYENQLERIWQSQARYAALAANYESNLFWQTERLVSSIAQEEEILKVARKGKGSAACVNIFRLLIKPYPAYASVTLYDMQGNPLCSSFSGESEKVGQDEWFTDVLEEKKPAVSGELFSYELREPILSFGGPVFENDTTIGVIGINIRLNWLAAIGQEPGLPTDSSIYLLDNAANVLVSSTPGDATLNSGLPGEQYRKDVAYNRVRSFDTKGVDENRRLYSVFPVRENGPYILLGRPWKEVVLPALQSLINQLIAWAAVSIAGFAAALLGARLLVTRWTALLAKAAKDISGGNVKPFPDLSHAPAEFRELGMALEYMSKKIAERENELQESVAQKQIMMREIHHRVKNNLQIVTSLLNVYARKPSSDATKQAFSDIQVRINTLALVHRHLYESQDLQAINLAPFMTNLCNLLYDGCGVSSRRIRMLVDIPTARVNGDRAVPLALLTTELLTNSFKHAFPGNRPGVIRVKMRLDESGDACLIIADDGIGNTSPANEGRFKMGQFLIDALTKQLGGWLEKSGPPGSITSVYFNLYQNASTFLSVSDKDSETAQIA